MGCIIANNINNGKINSTERAVVNTFGAKVFLDASKLARSAPNRMVSIDRMASIKEFNDRFSVKNENSNYIVKSAMFTGASFNRDALIKAGISEVIIDMVMARELGKNTTDESVDNINKFFKKKNRVFTSTPGIRKPGVYITNDTHLKNSTQITGNDVIVITNDDINELSVKNGKFYSANNVINNLIVSGLQRGFDVIFESPLHIEYIKQITDNYSARNGKTALYSNIPTLTLPGIIKYSDITAFTRMLGQDQNVYEDIEPTSLGLFIDSFLSGEERTLLHTHVKVSNSHKIRVANSILKYFKKLVPGLEYELRTSTDINRAYGKTFATKRGFIINGKIVVNLDSFSNETLFHEFGHFFSSWLKSTNPDVYNKFTEPLKNHSIYARVKAAYSGTGLAFSEAEILEETFVRIFGMNAAREFANLDENLKHLNEEQFDLQVNNFVTAFTNNLIGSVNYAGTLDRNININEIVNFQLNNANINTDMILDSNETMQSFASFLLPGVTSRHVFSQLAHRGLIKSISKDIKRGEVKLVLYDNNGNYVDRDGSIIKNPFIFKYYINTEEYTLSEKDRGFNRSAIKHIANYLVKNKDIATAMFDLGDGSFSIVAQEEAEQKIRKAAKGVVLSKDEENYVKNNKKLHRVSDIISNTFSYQDDENKYVLRTMYGELRKELAEKYALASLTDPDVIKQTEERINNEIYDIMKDPDEVKNHPLYSKTLAIFESKREEGTFLHGVSELLIRTLNIIQKIDYETKYEKTYDYFVKNIVDAIANPDKDARRKYFQKYIINRVAGSELATSTEYLEFVDILQKVDSYMTSEDSQRVLNYLLKLQQALNEHVFNELEGPLVFIPEVKVASEQLGVAGTIDLVVLDRYGRAHIFDYKTKEVGKEKNWDFPSGIMMKGAMKNYQSNAMMKASIQTSLYKLILNEYGVASGASKVFYVEGFISERMQNEDDKSSFVYDINNIYLKDLVDVTAELHQEFKDSLSKKNDTYFSDSLHRFILKVSGSDIDKFDDELTERAESILRDAIRRQNQEASRQGIDPAIAALIGIDSKPLVLRILGAIHKVPPHIKTEKARLDYIKDLLKNKVSAVSFEHDLETIFNKGNINTRDKKEAISALLGGASKDTHTLVKLSSSIDFGNSASGVVMLKDRITKETRIIVLNYDTEHYLRFANEDKGDTRNIFGNFITRDTAKTYTNTEWKATNHNLRLIKTGLILMRMKKVDPSFVVSNIISNSEEAKKGVPNLEDVETILNMTVSMIKVMQDAGEDIPQDILDLVQDHNVTRADSYRNNPIKALANYLSLSSDTSNGFKEEHLFKTATAKEHKETLKKVLDSYKEGDLLANVFDALHEFRHTLEGELKSEDAKLNSSLWELTDNIIMFLMGINYNLVPKNPNMVDRFLSTPSKAANLRESSFNRKIMAEKTSMNNEYMVWKATFNELLDNLASEYGIGLDGPAVKLSKKLIFNNLYRDPTNLDRNKAFILKSPDEVSSKAEKDILIFMQETFQRYAEQTTNIKQKIPYGWMPLMPKSKLSVQSDTNNPFEMAKNLLFGVRQDSDLYGESAKISDDMAFRNNNPFETQMPANNGDTEDVQFSFARRKKLGIDQDGNETVNAAEKDLNMLEDNLENVMDSFVMASLETKYYRDVTAFGRSLMFNVKRMSKLTGQNYGELINTLLIIQKRVINNETSEKKTKFMSALNNFATQVAISGTVNQALLETFTNPMVTLSNYFADKLYGVLYGGQRRFSSESYKKAVYAVWLDSKKRAVIDKIDQLYGITSSDSSQLKEVLNKLEQKSIFQSKHLMFFNRLMLDNWQKITMTAMLMEQGSFDAYSIDEYGNLKYDEDKDDKFNWTGAATAEESTYKKKVYDATKLELGKFRGGLTGNDSMDIKDRKLNRSLTEYERNEMKELIAQVYSSMDEESKGLAMYYTALGFMSKMKSWIFPKMPRYFQGYMTEEENESMKHLVKVDDPTAEGGYRLEWRASESEGILYTMKYLFGEVRRLGPVDFIKADSTLKPHQQENVAKLLADVGMWATLSLAAWGLFSMMFGDDDDKDPAAELLYKRYMAATGDVFLLYSLVDMMSGNGSAFISISIAARAAGSLLNLGVAGAGLLGGEDKSQQEFLSALNRVARNTHGVYRTGEFVFDVVNYEEK
jgi:hypothetical protein